MIYVYFCAKSPKERTELIPAEERETRLTHLRDLSGFLETKIQIPYSEREFPNSRIKQIRDKYKGRYRAFD